MRKFVRNDQNNSHNANFKSSHYQNRPRDFNPRPNTTDPYALSSWLMSTFNGCKVARRDGESTDNMLRRFKKMCEQAGITKELKKREFYLSPSQKKRVKKAKALKRLRKRVKMEEMNDFDPKLSFRPQQSQDNRNMSRHSAPVTSPSVSNRSAM
jgi:small subunit ribosomal protein S21